MEMKRCKKALALLLTLLITLLLVSGAIAGAVELEIEQKIIPSAGEQQPKPHSEMQDGEVYAYTRVTGDPLPSTEFTVEMNAIGRQYRVETVESRRYNIVLLLDVSNSMEGTRMTNMVTAANNAAKALVGNGNKIAAVTFASGTVNERSLSTRDIEFYQTTKGSDSQKDYVKISLRQDRNQGGTNIQKALRAGYSILKEAYDIEADDDKAVPVIILLSDGAPTYYVDDIDATGTTRGAGSESAAVNVAYTIAQAAYYKVLMPELEIFTIPFALDPNDSDTKFANATLNPTDANIAPIYATTYKYDSRGRVTSTTPGFGDTWAEALQKVNDSDIRAQMTKDYVTGSYSATNSAQSLSQALQSAIVHMQGYNPIAETKGPDGKLTDSSYLTAQYQIGKGFALAGNTMTVRYGGTDYTFEKSGSQYVYKPDNVNVPNAAIAKLELRVTDSGLVEWKIPASVLPVIPAGGDAQYPVDPITLRFKLAFDLETPDLEPETYPTSTSCTYTFTPVKDNPYYYTSETQVETFVKTTYYETQFQLLSDNQPSFSFADSKAGLASGYVPLGQASRSSTQKKTDGEPEKVAIKYSNTNYAFDNFTKLTATASFRYDGDSLPTSSASGYSVTSFKDGNGTSYSDARVTDVSGSSWNNNRTITVSYDYSGGQPRRSLVFQDVSFSRQSSSASVSAKVERVKTTFLIIFTRTDYYVTQIDSKDLNPKQSIGENGGTININDGAEYVFGKVSDAAYNSDGFATVTATKYYDFYHAVSNVQAAYYTAQSSVTGPLPSSFTESGNTLTVVIGGAVEAAYTKGTNVQFAKNDMGGYTVEQKIGGTTQVITYAKSNDIVTKTVQEFYLRNGIDQQSGKVSLASNPVGAIKLKDAKKAADEVAREVGAEVTLKSTYNSEFTMVTLRNEAEVYLYFTVTKPVGNLAFTLDTSNAGLLKSAKVLQVDFRNGSGYTKLGSAIPGSVEPGEYRIKYLVEFNKPAANLKATMLRFDTMTFTWEGHDGLLAHHPDYVNQQVRVSFDTTMGH